MGAASELVVANVMERRLGSLAEPYHQGTPRTLVRTAAALTAIGGVTVARWGRRRRSAATLGGAALLGGALAERFAVYHAGFASAKDPKYTVGPQRERVEQGRGLGAGRTPSGRQPTTTAAR